MNDIDTVLVGSGPDDEGVPIPVEMFSVISFGCELMLDTAQATAVIEAHFRNLSGDDLTLRCGILGRFVP